VTKIHQKTSFIFIVKNATLNALKKAIGLDTSPQQNIGR